MKANKIEMLTSTMEAICQSPEVKEYIIGITYNPPDRRNAYKNAEALLYSHFVLLDFGLTLRDAWKVESELQKRAAELPDCREKYHPDKRGQPHRRSSGGRAPHANERDYYVYMTWR